MIGASLWEWFVYMLSSDCSLIEFSFGTGVGIGGLDTCSMVLCMRPTYTSHFDMTNSKLCEAGFKLVCDQLCVYYQICHGWHWRGCD